MYNYVADTDTPKKCRTSMRKEDGYTEINLLLFDGHYMWISHLSRFLNSKAGAHRSLRMCPSCELHFNTKLALLKHAKYCRHKEGFSIQPRIAMPRVGEERLRFTEYTKTQFVPVIIYADFESILPPNNNNEIPTVQAPHEVNISHHVPCGFGVKLVCTLDESKTKKTAVYRSASGDDNIIDKFLEKLNEYEAEVVDWYANPKAMLPLTADEQQTYDDAVDCTLCNYPLGHSANTTGAFSLAT